MPTDQVAPATLRQPAAITPTIAYAGIGDEAGAGLRTQLDALARLGWGGIELRTVDGTWIADLDDQAFTRLADALAARGLTVAGVASRIGNWSRPITGDFDQDLDELDVLTHRCATLGTRYIRIMSYLNAGLDERDWRQRAIDRIRELAYRAEQAGLVLLHENCTGWAAANADRMLDLLDTVASPALRLLFDTGNGIAYGYQAYDLLADILPHVAHVHVKDAGGSAAHPVYTVPGAGQARVADCLRLLLRNGYTGMWSLEPHLTLRPHAGDAAGQGRHEGFIAAGRALEQLVRNQLLPTCPPWTAIPGGLSAFSGLSGVNEV
ncbi:MAG: sugar phosphate isomerase/epimerase family protein [Pseudonocardiaceae bacterium]